MIRSLRKNIPLLESHDFLDLIGQVMRRYADEIKRNIVTHQLCGCFLGTFQLQVFYIRITFCIFKSSLTHFVVASHLFVRIYLNKPKSVSFFYLTSPNQQRKSVNHLSRVYNS